jgi:hypothetical protein
VTCPSSEHIPVIYLTTIVLRDFSIFHHWKSTPSLIHLLSLLNIAQIAHLAFSLATNVCATSIIALKAWCVHVNAVFQKNSFTSTWLTISRAYIQEVQQVVDGKRVGCPNPDTGIQDIGSSDRVGCDLYSDWCKLRLAVQARVVTIFFLFRSRAWSLLPFPFTSDSPGLLKYSCPWEYSLQCVKPSKQLPSRY